jgi:hypothetical protein
MNTRTHRNIAGEACLIIFVALIALVATVTAFVKRYSVFQSCENRCGAGPGLVYRLMQTRESCHSPLWQASTTQGIFPTTERSTRSE